MAESLRDILVEMAEQINGLMAICIASMDGEPIESYTPPGSKWNIELTAVQWAQVVKLAQISVGKVATGGLEDILITTSDNYVLTRVIGDGSVYLGIATSNEAVLGMIRLIVKNYVGRLCDAIPGGSRS